MPNRSWTQAIARSAAPERARQYLAQLASAGASLAPASAEQARILCALFSGSQAASELLLAKPEWLASLTPPALQHARREQGLRKEVHGWLASLLAARDYVDALARLRQFKQREMLRLAARDLARLGGLLQIVREISDVADVCLSAVHLVCRRQVGERFGEPFHQDADGRWRPTQFCVLGLGKLGGQELNYSSDVDVIFVYSEEGGVFKVPPAKGTKAKPGLSNHQFFTRLAEAFIAEVGRLTADGTLYRIDLRLRPEGDVGPLLRSLASYENFYAQWGQTWERMMLIKARCVAGDASLAGEFLEMAQSFRYPRSLGENVHREIAAMKQRIENEVVKTGELDRNVKLGRGGIREIEFVAQTLQLLHAGRNPFLQGAQTLPTLEKLVQYELLPAAEAAALSVAYQFLRDVEHRCQMESNRQTHTIPSDAKARERLARLMGFKDAKEFEAARAAHARAVRASYDKLLQVKSEATGRELPAQFDGKEAEWEKLLAEHAFRDSTKAVRLLKEFALGPGFGHVSTRTSELAWQLIRKMLALCPVESEGCSQSESMERASATFPLTPALSPAAGEREERRQRVGERRVPRLAKELEKVLPLSLRGGEGRGEGAIRSFGALEVYGEGKARVERKPILSDPDRVLARLDTFISAYGARAVLYESWTANPSLFELLLLLFDRSEFLAEAAIRTPDLVDELVLSGHLRRRKSAAEILQELQHGRADADQRLWLRRYHQSEFMRIGLRDILGLADYEQNLEELSALADACLQYALEIVMRQHKLKTAPFAIIGLGKLGGAELNYGSDLDITFVAPTKGRNLPKLQRLAVEVMDLLSGQTEFGVAFVTDARLRPDGEKGLLVNTLAVYEEYYRQRAMLWEIQALTRIRPVAGDATTGAAFRTLAAKLTNFASFVICGANRTNVLARTPSPPPTGERAGVRGPRASAQPAVMKQARRQPLTLTLSPSEGERGPVRAQAMPVAFTPDWKQEIAKMRTRIERERTPPGQEALAFKTGAGGLIDAEFIAQTLCLAHGWQEANTLRALQLAERRGALPKTEAAQLIANYRKLRRVEAILRRWSFAGEVVLPDEPAPLYRVAVRCGWRSAEEFMADIAQCRAAIREVYAKVFAGSGPAS